MRLPIPFLLLFAISAASAQEPVAAIPGDQPTIALFGRISAWTVRMEPVLGQMKTAEWVAKGASETYSAQAASALAQLRGIAQEMSAMQRHPDALQDGLKALYRVHAFQRTLTSVLTGLRRYQNPALADLTVEMAAESTRDLQELEEHLLEVATRRENDYAVVEREAQRCRGVMTREAMPAPRQPVRKPGQ